MIDRSFGFADQAAVNLRSHDAHVGRNTDEASRRIVETAYEYLGAPYVRGGTTRQWIAWEGAPVVDFLLHLTPLADAPKEWPGKAAIQEEGGFFRRTFATRKPERCPFGVAARDLQGLPEKPEPGKVIPLEVHNQVARFPLAPVSGGPVSLPAAHVPGGPYAFVTPAIDGKWILVVGCFWATAPAADEEARIDDLKARLAALSRQFGEVQAFVSHRVVDYYAWILARDGETTRSFAYCTDEGLLDNGGELTPVKQTLTCFPWRFDDLPDDVSAEEYDAASPNEEDVITVATAWSLNPLELGEEIPCEGTPLVASTGLAAKSAPKGCLLGGLLPLLFSRTP